MLLPSKTVEGNFIEPSIFNPVHTFTAANAALGMPIFDVGVCIFGRGVLDQD